jgi:hypothetical protein
MFSEMVAIHSNPFKFISRLQEKYVSEIHDDAMIQRKLANIHNDPLSDVGVWFIREVKITASSSSSSSFHTYL